MIQLTTFEDIFNKLHDDYQGQNVEVVTRQGGLNISCFKIRINEIQIRPLTKKESQKWQKRGKVGLLVIKASARRNSINIPFILGYDTMSAVFFKDCVMIRTLELEFVFKKTKQGARRLA